MDDNKENTTEEKTGGDNAYNNPKKESFSFLSLDRNENIPTASTVTELSRMKRYYESHGENPEDITINRAAEEAKRIEKTLLLLGQTVPPRQTKLSEKYK